MVAIVEFAFETLCDIVNAFEAMFEQQVAGLLGAVAAAADQHYRHASVLGRFDHTAENQLAHFALEIGVDDEVGFIDPWDIDRADRMTDE